MFHRDGIAVRRWRTAWRTACQAAGVPTRFLHDCRRTAARNLIRANVPERVAMLLTGHKSRAIFDRYNIIHEQELLEGRGPTRRLSGTAGAGGASKAAAPRGQPRLRAHGPVPPPRATRHRVRAHGPPGLVLRLRSWWTALGCPAGRCCMKDLLRVGRFGPLFSSPQEPHCRDAVEGSFHV